MVPLRPWLIGDSEEAAISSLGPSAVDNSVVEHGRSNPPRGRRQRGMERR